MGAADHIVIFERSDFHALLPTLAVLFAFQIWVMPRISRPKFDTMISRPAL